MSGKNVIDESMQEALACQRNGDLKKAAEICGLVLQVAPDRADALHLLGFVAHQIGNHEAALDLISRAIKLSPDVPEYYDHCGSVCRSLGLNDEALNCYRKAVELSPDHVSSLQSMVSLLLKKTGEDEARPRGDPALSKSPGKIGGRMSAKMIPAAIDKAVKFHQAGNLEAAERIYREVLASHPDNADALHLLGLMFHQRGDDASAVDLIGRAVKISPAVPFIHNNMGNALQGLGRVGEAARCYRRAIELDPKYVEPYLNLGTAFQEQGELDEAVSCYRRALSLNPDYAKAHNNLGKALDEQGKLEEGLVHVERAVAIDPNYAEAQNNLGALLNKLSEKDRASRQLEKAIANLERAIEINPNYGEAHNNLGIACKNAGKLDEAIVHFERAAALKPHFAEAFNNLGAALRERKEYGKALSCFENALKIKPEYADAHNNLGVVLNDLDRPREAMPHFEFAMKGKPDDPSVYLNMGTSHRILARFDEAQACYRKAISLKPDYTDALNNLATIFQSNGKAAEAVRIYEEAMQLAPDVDIIHWNLALSLLTAGEIARGWDKYDYRWKSSMQDYIRPFAQPWWDGSDLSGKTILLWAEQGVGDEILFANAVPDVLALARHCIVECDPRLVPLFARSFPLAEVIARSNPPHPRTREEDIDVQSPMGNLPKRFRRSMDSFPRKGGFLQADPEKVDFWKDRIARAGGGLKVGFAWRSRHMTHLRKVDFTELAQWGPIFSVPGIRFVNLQYDDCNAELEEARRLFGVEILAWDDIDLMNQMDEVAALTSACDLVISAGTSVSAMAGALGVPTWRLSSPEDWILLGSDHVPWFPSMRAFRLQWGMGWDDVIGEMAGELRRQAEVSGTAS